MLQELIIHNYAIIRHLEISFQSGLNVLSGETGAGKSIVVGAVNLILGSRASQEMIRTGENEATVEAVFPVSGDNASLRINLHEWGLDGNNELIIRRSINRSGRNRIFINGQIVTLQQLQQLSRGLISVSGQHEHQLLLDPEVHLALLDTYGNLEAPCQKVGDLFSEWSNTREKLSKLRRFRQEQSDRLDYLKFQLQEIESANLQPDEDRLLEQERNILKHAATLMEAARGAHQALYSGKGAVLEQLANVEKNIKTLQQIDSSQEALLHHLEEARIQLEELSHSLQQYAHRVSFDPQRLSAIEERLALLQKLGKKHGGSVESMIQKAEQLRQELATGEETDLREEELEKTLEQLRLSYLDEANGLSLKRRETAEQLAKEVEALLAALDMSRAQFAVSFKNLGNCAEKSDPLFTPTGIDQLEFMLSANPGESLKPLVRVASGGELSRILLALKSLLSRRGEAETLIFDEVDTGISGRTAELMGLQLKRLAEKHQVICITHLPQIACYGIHHFRVAKDAVGEETFTDIQVLSPEERIEELSRMLGGICISETARDHAKELLQRAREA